MNSLNQIILEGNLVRDPESKTLPTGTPACTLPIAVNRSYKNASGEFSEEVSYFDIETYGGLADSAAKWCSKGRGIRVVGRLKQDRWKDEDGKSHNRIKVIAEHIDFKPFPKPADGASGNEEKSASGTAKADTGKVTSKKVNSTKKIDKDLLDNLINAAAANINEDSVESEMAF